MTVAVAIAATFAWIIAWYWDTAAGIAQIWWRSDTFAHGMVVLPLFAWLVWQKRGQLALCKPEPVPLMVLPVAMAGFGWLLGEMVSVAALAHLSLVSMIVVALVAMLGWRISRLLAFPLLFLLFGVPIGEFLLPTLMLLTADFTIAALRLSGVPVYQEGLQFIVPNGRWSVVEACSGIRYLIASAMVGTLYAYLNYRSLKRRLLFVGVTVAVALVANWMRAYLIVMLGYLSDNRIAAGVDHLIYGWVFFGVVIFVIFLIGARWREDGEAKPLPLRSSVRSDWRWVRVVPLAAVVVVFPLMQQQVEKPVEPFSVTLDAPQPAASWLFSDEDFRGYRPHFKGHRGEIFQAYRREDGRAVGLYVAYYAKQGEGAELVTWNNGLVSASGSQSEVLVASGRGNLLSIGEVRLGVVRDGTQRLAVWNWYWANNRVVTSDYLAKAVLAIDRLTVQPDDSAFLAVMTTIDDRPEEALPIVDAFMRDHSAAIEAMLLEAGRR